MEQRDGGLFAHPCHAGNVVGCIADHGLIIHHLIGADAQKGFHVRREIILGFGQLVSCQVDHHPVGDQLQQVAVAGDDLDRQPLGGCLAGNAAQDVVSFVSLHFQAGGIESVDQLADTVNLDAQVIGHLGAGAFVCREQVISKGLTGIESHCQVIGLVLFEQPQHDAGKAIDACRRLAALGPPAVAVL